MFKMSGKFMLKKWGVYLSCLLGLGLMGSCQEEESCVSFATNVISAGFYSFDEKGAAVPVELNFERVGARGTDSLFFVGGTVGVNQMLLALNPASDTTTFLFRSGLGADSLQLTYQRTFRMISPECGMEVRYTNMAVGRHTFDSVGVLTEEALSKPQAMDLRIFHLASCESLVTSRLQTGFFALDEAGEQQVLTLNFDRIRALESDSVFYERKAAGINSLNLRLHTAEGANSTTFVFENEEGTDTLKVAYEQRKVLLSPECGVERLYANLSIQDHTFDSVRLLNTVLSETTNGFDVEIYP